MNHETNQRIRILDSISDASIAVSELRTRFDKLIDRCEVENRYPSIRELKDMVGFIDGIAIPIQRAQELINKPVRTSKTWTS
nr:MAG TPA: Phycoerythrin Alpha subunit, Phycoerythrin Beta, marine cyanobacterium Phormidium sp.A09DM [Crassvirales sp.]